MYFWKCAVVCHKFSNVSNLSKLELNIITILFKSHALVGVDSAIHHDLWPWPLYSCSFPSTYPSIMAFINSSLSNKYPHMFITYVFNIVPVLGKPCITGAMDAHLDNYKLHPNSPEKLIKWIPKGHTNISHKFKKRVLFFQIKSQLLKQKIWMFLNIL